jgi:hypothetical protein
MNPKLAAGIGAVVGMFLSPAAWVALLALTAGRAAINAVNSLTTNPLPPELGGGQVPTQPAPGMPGWLTTLLLVSVVVTVLSALFFAWIGHTLGRLQQDQHLPQQDRQLQHAG